MNDVSLVEKDCNRVNECLCDPTVTGSDHPDLVKISETVTSPVAQIIPIPPTLGDTPHKLAVYFVLNGHEVGPEPNDSASELPVKNPATFIKISMDFTSEKPGEIHDLLRHCVGVIVQTQQGNGEPQITPLAVAGK